MNKKLSVLRRITAIVLCVTLLSSQVVVANDEDSERMDVQTNSEITDISEQDGFSSDTSETSDITEVIFLILLKANQSQIQILVLR